MKISSTFLLVIFTAILTSFSCHGQIPLSSCKDVYHDNSAADFFEIVELEAVFKTAVPFEKMDLSVHAYKSGKRVQDSSRALPQMSIHGLGGKDGGTIRIQIADLDAFPRDHLNAMSRIKLTSIFDKSKVFSKSDIPKTTWLNSKIIAKGVIEKPTMDEDGYTCIMYLVSSTGSPTEFQVANSFSDIIAANIDNVVLGVMLKLGKRDSTE